MNVYGAVGLVAAIVIAAVGIGMVSGFMESDEFLPPAPAESAGWAYDDYKEAGGAVSASGAIELLQTDSGSYLHAWDLGSGTITYPGARVENVTVYPARLDVYLMTGQSNASYNGVNIAVAEPLPAPGTAYAFMEASGKYGSMPDISLATFRPMVSPDGESLTGDKAPSFAAAVTAATGHKVYWICGAWGGRSINTFNPLGGTTWNYMAEVVSAAFEAIPDDYYIVTDFYYMWIQGESDKNMAVSTYKERFMPMHEAILGGALSGHVFSHCFISLPRWADGLNACTAQIELAEEHPDTITIATDIAYTFTEANGMLTADGIHYSQAGDNIIGTALGEAIVAYQGEPSPGGNADVFRQLISVVCILIAAGCLIATVYYAAGRL